MDAGPENTMQTWVKRELETVDIGDQRLNERYALILDRLSKKPSLSIPAACGNETETAGAYRFFDNGRVTELNILQPHHDATLKRIQAEPVVLMPQDTTEIDVTRPQEAVGGPLNDSARRGLFAHLQLAITPQRLSLGVAAAEIWKRVEEDKEVAQSQAEKRKKRRASPIDEKESVRWLDGYRNACEVAQQCPQTQVVSLSDSEGDIYECFVEGVPKESRRADWVVRACQDRALVGGTKHLRASILSTPRLGELTIEVSKRDASTGDGRKRRQARSSARQAKVSVRAKTVWLRPPYRSGGVKLPKVQVNAVLVLEENPPAGEQPVEWLLLTSLPIKTFTEAIKVVEYYCCRWEVEIYFRVLKSGCRVESLQFEETERLTNCLAVYLIVAWRVMHLLMLGRTQPGMDCNVVLEEAEWKSVYEVVTGKAAPKIPPPLAELVRMIAGLGGYRGRKHDGPPGPKTMWIGIQRMHDLAAAWKRFGPDAKRVAKGTKHELD